MTEILFIVEEADEGGYVAHAVGASIVTEAGDLDQLREMVRDAVRCHFDDADAHRPQLIRLHLVHDEVIAAKHAPRRGASELVGDLDGDTYRSIHTVKPSGVVYVLHLAGGRRSSAQVAGR